MNAALEFPRLLLGTVWLRPYVFAFLALYLFVASREMGWRRTVGFALMAYGLAWACEKASIEVGVPFGFYRYLPATLGRELWVLGVPFFDSLSFVFLTYFSHATARFVLSPIRTAPGWRVAADDPDGRVGGSLGALFLAPLLMMILDVVIDPITLRGDRWFLGKLYEYPAEGLYFGVPLANFAGWYVVGFLVLFVHRAVGCPGMSLDHAAPRRFPLFGLYSPAIYLGIAAFNLAITWMIGEKLLFLIGLLIVGPLAITIGILKRTAAGPGNPAEAVAAAPVGEV